MSFDVHVFTDRNGKSRASVTTDDGRRLRSVELTEDELGALVVIVIRTRAAADATRGKGSP